MASLWPCVEVEITVVGWFRPDGKLWDIYDTVTLQSPMLFPNNTGFMPLSVKSVT